MKLQKIPDPAADVPVLFFDIDGTLTRSGEGRRAMSAAFAELFGAKGAFDSVDFSGRTDPLILREAFQRYDLDFTEEKERDFFELYFEELGKTIENSIETITGMNRLLEKISSFDLQLGIITGNNYPGARLKLETVGLAKYFAGGGFGEDGPQRLQIAKTGLRRFGFPAARTLMIGDSIHDIRVAEELGMISVGVSTGHTEYERLEEKNPDYLFEKLTFADLEEIMNSSRLVNI
ncbi:MAG: HAD family hydrolase [bacterium]